MIIKRREVPSGAQINPNALLDRIYRSRQLRDPIELNYSLASLIKPTTLSGVDNAVSLLAEGRLAQKKIIIIGDFDADGATSTALSIKALRMLGFQHVNYVIPNRFEQGYGLSTAIAEVVIAQGAEIVITVDNGISSIEGVKCLKQAGITVIVTDHHLPAEQLPNADAIVNPNLNECEFPSKSLAGVGVIFYLIGVLSTYLFEQKIITEKPDLRQLLDLVALGTVADVVPLDHNNRILVAQGLHRINTQNCCYGIQALVEIAKRELSKLVASDLGFSIGPRLNAAGRLDNMSIGVELLLSEDYQHARQLAYELDSLNQTRKEIELGMKLEALKICNKLNHLTDENLTGIAIYQADWHQGVLGIVAARIKERFHRPVVAFALDKPGVLKGSARSISGLHMRDALELISQRHPEIIIAFGGHAMAAGLSLHEEHFERFQQVFNEVCAELLTEEQLTGIILSDGELSSAECSIETAELLRASGPWGQAFPEPLFDGDFKVIQQRIVGSNHLKLLLEPIGGGRLIDAIAFNVDTQCYPDLSIKVMHLAYRLDINEYNGSKNVQLIVEHIIPQ